MSLLLFQLRDELNRLSSLPGSVDTNVESLRLNDWGLLEFEATPHRIATLLEDRETEAKALEAEVKTLEEQVNDAEKRADTAEERLEECLQTLDDLKDAESGVTVAEMMERMKIAEADTELSRERVRQWAAQDEQREREMKALRARKGVGPKVMANLGNITALVRQVAEGKAVDRATAAELLARLTAKD